LTLFRTTDGAEGIVFPLSVHVASSERLVSVWQIHGTRIRDPHPSGKLKRIEHEIDRYSREFAARAELLR
jgi:hypothetical protein